MKMTWALALGAGLLPAVAGADPGLKIRHQPLACIPTDRYAVITAEGEPAERVATAELQFRVDEHGGWYSSGMKLSGGTWTGLMPRATRPLPRLEYRIAMMTSRLETTTTDPVAVSVSEAGCTEPAKGAVDSAIVMTVPEGAPLVPPVPVGFSPVGVAAHEEKPRGQRKLVALGATAVVAGGLAAVVSTSKPLEGPEPLPTFPRFLWGGTSPSTTQTLSVSQTPLQVFVFLDRLPAFPFDMSWSFELLSSGVAQPCLQMSGSLTGVQLRNVTLQAPMVSTGACPAEYTASGGHLRIVAGGEVRYEFTHNVPYRVGP